MLCVVRSFSRSVFVYVLIYVCVFVRSVCMSFVKYVRVFCIYSVVSCVVCVSFCPSLLM